MKVVITRAFICKSKVLRIGLASSRRKKGCVSQRPAKLTEASLGSERLVTRGLHVPGGRGPSKLDQVQTPVIWIWKFTGSMGAPLAMS